MAKIRIPNHTIFRQIFVLYVLPVFIGAIAWFLIKFLNW
ncbi:YniB family protein [Klebsiella pneumoniae]|nr:YniB family protein [Klebsiella pneumoniae]